MSTSSIDLNELQNNGNNVGVCDGEQRLNFMRHVTESEMERLNESQFKVINGTRVHFRAKAIVLGVCT